MYTFTIHSLSREKFEEARTKLAAQNVVVSGDTGEIDHGSPFGEVKLSFAYSEKTQDLIINIIKHPPFSVGKIEQTVEDWFA